ncbi:MAG: (2Fe-2S)-binding protein [Actinobacteria bacterium]|nr:(2Fe-2S)-binding protein [Actinomycetota bacterium]
MEKISVIIDGRTFKAVRDQCVLEVAHENGIYIPSLCYNSEVASSGGSCRVCLVEAHQGGRMRLVTSCNYPVREGLEIKTDTPLVHRIRRGVLELLMARVPDSEVIREMAAAEGLTDVRFRKDEGENDRYKCIACAMCTNVCAEVVGVYAISMVNRGADKKPATPYYKPSDVCIGCGACAYACPTGAIIMTERDGVRRIWGKDFRMVTCSVCGTPYIPEAQVDWIVSKTGKDRSFFDKCPDHR